MTDWNIEIWHSELMFDYTWDSTDPQYTQPVMMSQIHFVTGLTLKHSYSYLTLEAKDATLMQLWKKKEAALLSVHSSTRKCTTHRQEAWNSWQFTLHKMCSSYMQLSLTIVIHTMHVQKEKIRRIAIM